MVDKNKINEVAKKYLDTALMNAEAIPEEVYEFITALEKVPGLPTGITFAGCRKLGRLEKWVNRHFSEKSSNIRFNSSYLSKDYDSYSIVEHIRKESGLDFIGIKIFGKEFGALLTYDLGDESYASLSLWPFNIPESLDGGTELE